MAAMCAGWPSPSAVCAIQHISVLPNETPIVVLPWRHAQRLCLPLWFCLLLHCRQLQHLVQTTRLRPRAEHLRPVLATTASGIAR